MARPKKERVAPEPVELGAEEARAGAIAAVEQQIKAAERIGRLTQARGSLIEFTRLMMPSPEDPDDSDKSRYEVELHHRCIAAAMEEVESGRVLRLIITLPPRAGKSELAAKQFIPWAMGKDPYRQVIFATYNQTFAEDTGRAVRDRMQQTIFKQVFPSCGLRKGSKSADRIQSAEGGTAVFVGAGGAITGRGADLLVIDDIIKDSEQANSQTERRKIWEWFTQVAMTRLMGAGARVIIIMTRWHDDDLVGRITDPKNDCYNEEEAKNWKILHIPAIAKKDDVLGRPEGASLWPSRFPIEFLEQARRMNPRAFSALYQGDPTPDDGEFFKREWLQYYKAKDLPTNLRKYVASDHAVSTAQERDCTVMIPIGVDKDDNIWILPDVFWRRAQTDVVVDAMIDMMHRHTPLLWFAESGHITKSIGPFLRKRMKEECAYITIREMTPSKDKMTRAQSINARMSMGKVFFPDFVPWKEDAVNELLKFPSARHDDFVDAISWIGIGLNLQVGAGPAKKIEKPPVVGSIAWIKQQSKFEEKNRITALKDGF